MMLGQLGDLRPDAYRRKAFEEMAASVRPRAGAVSLLGRETKFQPERVMADLYLGVTVAGLYTLVGMGIIIAFM
jgi:hypothetical protein